MSDIISDQWKRTHTELQISVMRGLMRGLLWGLAYEMLVVLYLTATWIIPPLVKLFSQH